MRSTLSELPPAAAASGGMSISHSSEATESASSACTSDSRARACADDRPDNVHDVDAPSENESVTWHSAQPEDVNLRPTRARVCGLERSAEAGAATSSTEECVLADPAAGPEQAAQLPPAAVLLEVLKKMLLSSQGGPAASGGDGLVAQVTKGLVLIAAEAVVKLFKSSRAQIAQACGMLDEREALAYLVGDVTGLGLIAAEAARKAGDKAGKLVWVLKGQSPIEKELSDARRAVQRRASKLPEGTLETELESARSAVLRGAVELPLQLTAAECAAARRAAKRKREAPPPPAVHEKVYSLPGHRYDGMTVSEVQARMDEFNARLRKEGFGILVPPGLLGTSAQYNLKFLEEKARDGGEVWERLCSR